MTWPSASQVQSMTDTVEEFLLDTCVILSEEETEADDGEILKTYTEGSPIPCRWSPVTEKEEPRGTFTISDTEWKLTVPGDTVVSYLDMVRLTHKMDVALETPLEAQVSGDPQVVLGALQINLRKVKS
jgi:hypothetical protein